MLFGVRERLKKILRLKNEHSLSTILCLVLSVETFVLKRLTKSGILCSVSPYPCRPSRQKTQKNHEKSLFGRKIITYCNAPNSSWTPNRQLDRCAPYPCGGEDHFAPKTRKKCEKSSRFAKGTEHVAKSGSLISERGHGSGTIWLELVKFCFTYE